MLAVVAPAEQSLDGVHDPPGGTGDRLDRHPPGLLADAEGEKRYVAESESHGEEGTPVAWRPTIGGAVPGEVGSLSHA